MYLKNIEVYGFKSFAQKINFEFHNGITGIVGPNGSGKSNVGDAVRWVLGEQSAKQLRGGNMQDVIFSGTENRKPLSYASVSITLDNSDHKLPVDYQEVTVTRRLYRSGESEYLMNGSHCRLKDIQELFYDTGIGKEGYSIIGQGQIDKILSGKPEERRELFDEAAGIVKFKRRKNTTLKKLEEEKQNLVRVTDILSELDRQLGPLEKQSETARKYLEQKERLKEREVNLFLQEMEEITASLEEKEEKSRLTRGQLEETSADYEKVKVEYEELEGKLENLNRKIDQARERMQQDALARQQMEGQIEILKEQIHSARQNEEHYRERQKTICADQKSRSVQLEQFRQEQEELKGRLSGIRRQQKEKEERLSQVQEQIESCSQAVEEGKNEIIEVLNSRVNTKGKVQRFDTMMEQINIRKAQLNQQKLSLRGEEQQQQKDREEAQARHQKIEEKIQKLRTVQEDKGQELQRLQGQLEEEKKQFEIGSTTYHREESRLESLVNLTERYEGYGNSIRRVMEQKKKVPGILGVVADLIQVEKDYEIAIETALGGSIQNIVTDHEQTAKQMIEFLKRNRYGRATFLPLTSIEGRGEFRTREALQEPGVLGIASDLVKVGKGFENLSRYLLGRTLVVDHMDHAIAIGKKYRHSLRMVTLEGESLNPGGSMTGGAFRNNSNLLGRRREIEELQEAVKRLKTEMAQLQNSMEKNRGRRNQLRDDLTELKELLQEEYLRENTVRLQLQKIEEKQQEMQKSYEQMKREGTQILQQIREVEENRMAISAELEASKKDEKELEAFIESRQKELEEWQEEESAISHDLEQIRMDASAMAQKTEFAGSNIARVKRESQALEEELLVVEQHLREDAKDVTEKEKNIEGIRQKIQESREKEETQREQTEAFMREKEQTQEVHKSFFDKRDELSGQISLLDKELFRLNQQVEKLTESQEQKISYMWEEYEITPNSAKSYRKEEMQDGLQLKKEIGEIKEAIRKLGNVNVNAIEDYKELKERHTFLSGQYQDLVEAEASLQSIIQELDEGMRKQFTEKFKEIQKEFDKAFKELFGGGKGTLELIEDEDILEAGIRIISQPPGKKLQNMMQLSGGEKALTAIALLFAIQNLKPSPFCLLDEIEAALDDSNVGRFAGYLKKLTKNTQFIIITHRRGTMGAADRLYGITMQEKGVSTLVSVDLVEKDLDK
ncbi:MAG TPA: chromosome segregation protein SMC [Candidatus Blautia intestinigallinarum]|nr:chromosome segregation protein SMC [Candidatus Blautia intestinigallinarum]